MGGARVKSWAGAFLAGTFVLALLAAMLRGHSGKIRMMEARLEESEDRMREQRGEFDRVRRHRHSLEKELEDLRGRLDGRDPQALYSDILAPSVQINGNGGMGGGTIIYSQPGHTYVITAFHVVRKAVRGDRSEPVLVRIFDADGALLDTVDADVAAHDPKKDLALLRARKESIRPRVARLATREALRKVRVFEPVYAVGCPLGHDPLPTRGEVATLNKEVGGERFWMMSAPTTFGNSGGGIFHRESRRLIGVSVMVCTYEGEVATPVPHLGILISMEGVYDWLDSIHYRFLYDPRLSIDDEAREREAAVVRSASEPLPLEDGGAGGR